MKRLRIITFICLLLSAALLGASTIARMLRKDNTLPVIEITDKQLVLDVKDLKGDALLTGVTARDDKDGDLTDRIQVSNIAPEGSTTLEVTYMVADDDDHAVTAVRTVKCPDFVPPRFHLETPLRFDVGSDVQVRGLVTAADVLDGDITGDIKINTNDLDTDTEGTYPVTFEVTNSLGIAAEATMDVIVHTPADGEPEIELSDYLVYLDDADDFHALDYLSAVHNGDDRSINVDLPDGGLQEGVNQVVYTCNGYNGTSGRTMLYVVVE